MGGKEMNWVNPYKNYDADFKSWSENERIITLNYLKGELMSKSKKISIINGRNKK
jgi:hypothetical protein